ncbi:phage tail spike protein [Halobacillus litoralis]|uniref:phage tail spike protein n=1 Tax=Halobacillus litoralis TaxID=45668 RepID=UPI001CD67761|nr:phage tail spike protein [Halobacillus litoralis]MCA1021657.1 phage tail protein [Halobacillus litoralis]
MEENIRIFIAKPDRTIIGEAMDFKVTGHNKRVAQVDEISFEIPFHIQDPLTMEPMKNHLFDEIRERYLLWVTDDKTDYSVWFRVERLNNIAASQNKVKAVHAYEKAYELSGEPIPEWAGVFVDGEYRKESLTIAQVAYDLADGTSWSVGTIDSKFDEYRRFDFNSTNVLAAFYELAETFKAVIIWDTYNNVINLIHEDNYGDDPQFHISAEKYLKSIDQEIDSNEIVTKIIPYGFEGITINSINPSGSNYVMNYNHFLFPFERDEDGNTIRSSFWMSDDLCHAYLDYIELMDTKVDEYNDLVKVRDGAITRRAAKNNDLADKKTELDNIQTNIDLIQTLEDPTEQQEKDLKQHFRDEKTVLSEIDALNYQLDVLNERIDDCNEQIQHLNSMLNTKNNFTISQQHQLSSLGKTETWTSEKYDDPEELLKGAKEELDKKSVPPTLIRIGLADLYQIGEAREDLKNLRLGDVVYVDYESFGISVQARIIEMSINYHTGAIDVVIANITDLNKDANDELVKELYKNSAMAGKVLKNESKWSKVVEVEDTINSFVNSSLDATNQEIKSGANETVTINNRGITISDDQDPLNFIRMVNGAIGLTSDGGQTLGVAITPRGVIAEKLVGKIIAGENLVIENTSGKYTLDANGFTIDGGAFRLIGGISTGNLFSFSSTAHTDGLKSSIDNPYLLNKSKKSVFVESDTYLRSEKLPCKPNEDFILRFDYINTNPSTVNLRGRVRFEDAQGSYAGNEIVIEPATEEEKTMVVRAKAPDDAFYVMVEFRNENIGESVEVNGITWTRGSLEVEYSPHPDDALDESKKEKWDQASEDVFNSKDTWDRAANFDTDGKLNTQKLNGIIDVATNRIHSSSEFYWDANGLIAKDPDEPNRIVQMSSGGLGVSVDGGQTFHNAITAEGIVGELIVAEKLSAITANLGEIDAGTIKGIYIEGSEIVSPKSLKSYRRMKAVMNEGYIFSELVDDFYTDEVYTWTAKMEEGKLSFSKKMNDVVQKLTTYEPDRIETDQAFVLDAPKLKFATSAVIEFSNGSSVDDTGGSVRLRHDNRNYMRQAENTVQFYHDADVAFTITTLVNDNHNRWLNLGAIAIKGLSSGSQLQIRNSNDTGYRQVTASDFVTASKREYKDNIRPYDKSALDLIDSMNVYTYTMKDFDQHYNEVLEDRYRLGHIKDEVPNLIQRGDGIDIYALSAFQTKAIQELSNRIKQLENQTSAISLKVNME